jgi:hypothetical protein
MEHALTVIEPVWRERAQSPELDDLDALRGALIEQVLFSEAYPQVLRIMNHEGATASARVRFVVERFVNPLRPGVEALLSRRADAGRIRLVPYPTLRYLAVAGGGALYANPVEVALLGAPVHPDPDTIRAHAETLADLLIAGITAAPSPVR